MSMGVEVWPFRKKPEIPVTALIDSLLNKDFEMAEDLVAKGFDLTIRDQHGYSALHAAAISGATKLAEAIVFRGGKIDLCDNCGNTPLFLASSGNLEIVKILLDRGADPNIKNSIGVSPIMMAAISKKKEIAELLAAHGSNIEMVLTIQFLEKSHKLTRESFNNDVAPENRTWLTSSVDKIFKDERASVISVLEAAMHKKTG